MVTKPTSSTSSAPWREGRPSFKGYRVEFFLLILFTLVCIICAIIWTSSIVKQNSPRSQTTSPASTSFYASSSFAFAQDVSLDETVASIPEGTESSEEESSAAQVVETPSVDDQSEVASTPEATESPESPENPNATQTIETSSVTNQSGAASNKVAGTSSWSKIILVWIVCLVLPLVLWIWRGWVWFSTIFGIKYELRCDADNPRATTFLITRGIFQKRTDSMHIGQIVDIHSEQSLIQKYLLGGVGNVVLHTKDLTDPVLKMKNLDEPNRVFNAFDELRRHYWGRGGVQIGDEGIYVNDAN